MSRAIRWLVPLALSMFPGAVAGVVGRPRADLNIVEVVSWHGGGKVVRALKGYDEIYPFLVVEMIDLGEIEGEKSTLAGGWRLDQMEGGGELVAREGDEITGMKWHGATLRDLTLEFRYQRPSSSMKCVIFDMVGRRPSVSCRVEDDKGKAPASAPTTVPIDSGSIAGLPGHLGFEAAQAPRPETPSVLGLRTLRSGFADVLGKLGPAPRVRLPGEAGSVVLCYVSASPGEPTWLVFESGPMGAWGRLITEYEISVREPWQPPELTGKKCRVSRLVERRLELSNGLRLGLSDAQVKAIMGPPIEQEIGHLTYHQKYPLMTAPVHDGTPQSELFGHIWVTIRVDAGSVTAIRVSQTEAN